MAIAKLFTLQANATKKNTAWKKSKYGVLSGTNTGKYGPDKTPYLDTFHAMKVAVNSKHYYEYQCSCNFLIINIFRWRQNWFWFSHGLGNI